MTIPFALVGYNTSDIQQIVVSDAGLGTIGWGGEIFTVWEGVPTVAEGSSYTYWDASADPTQTATGYYWGNDACEKASYSIAPGQGVVVNCAEGLAVTAAGQVNEGDVTFTSIADNNFTGNPFASAIDIQDISVSDGNMGTIGWGGEIFTIWEGVPTVREGSSYTYWDASADPEKLATGYYWGNDACEKATYAIPAGQGVVINCVEGLTVTIKAPYSL